MYRKDVINEENDGRLVYTIADAANLVAIAVAAEREACADFLEHGVFDDDGHHKQHNTLKSSVQEEVSDED